MLKARIREAAPLLAVATVMLAGCGGGSQKHATSHHTHTAPKTVASTPPKPPPPPPPPYARIVPGTLSSGSSSFLPAAVWNGHTAVRIAHLPTGVVLLSLNQSVVTLHLHSGTIDAGAVGYRFGPSVVAPELKHIVAAFNGGFRLSTGAGGFEAGGHVAVPLRFGLGSIVTYGDGTTDIGSWREEVPAAGKTVASVRQNLTLLIDHGRAASSISCVSCWGATLGGVIDPARAALGIDANGNLIWAGGEHLTVQTLVNALLGAHVVRAVELDINPEWVAGYLYAHHSPNSRPVPLPVISSQTGIPGQFLIPWSRDFFTVVVR